MAFVTKTWKDRMVEFAGRRKLKNVSTNESVLYDVSRSEGTVMQAGDSFSATNMNDLEQRIKTEFDNVNSSLTANGSQLCMDYHDGKYGVNTDPQRGADTFIPFKSNAGLSIVKEQNGWITNAYGQDKLSYTSDKSEDVSLFVSVCTRDQRYSVYIYIDINGERVVTTEQKYYQNLLKTLSLTKNDKLDITVLSGNPDTVSFHTCYNILITH